LGHVASYSLALTSHECKRRFDATGVAMSKWCRLEDRGLTKNSLPSFESGGVTVVGLVRHKLPDLAEIRRAS
jgi:hypothetical protein